MSITKKKAGPKADKNRVDFVAIVNARLKELEWSNYRLVQELKGKRPDGTSISTTSVYNFTNGVKDILSADLGILLSVIGVDVVSKDSDEYRKDVNRRRQGS